MINYWDVFTHPCPGLNDDIVKTPFEVRKWSINYINIKALMLLRIHVVNSVCTMLVKGVPGWWNTFNSLRHICVSKINIIGSDNSLSPGQHQAIIWINAGILFIWPLRTNFSEIYIDIHISRFKKMHLKMSSAKCRPFFLGLNVLTGLYNTADQSLPVMQPWETWLNKSQIYP